MSIPESLAVALFCITMVFGILACLFLLIKLFSLCIHAIESKKKPVETTVPNIGTDEVPNFSNGELKLYHVDEPTAAMIMAIVSDESGIPLSELCFKSIKVIDH